MKVFTLTFFLFLAITSAAQHVGQGFLVDQFFRPSNDDLLAHVDSFLNLLHKNPDKKGYVVLYGPPLSQYLMKRRIEGCGIMRNRSTDDLEFVFAPDLNDVEIRFYAVPMADFRKVPLPDFKLPNLKTSVELNSAFSTDEFCPLHFDLEWFANFMRANPQFRGRVIIDSSKHDFIKRVVGYRKTIAALGVASHRIKFIRRLFVHERDEQWWLIPNN